MTMYAVKVRVSKTERTIKALAANESLARLHVMGHLRQYYGVRESILFLGTEVVK